MHYSRYPASKIAILTTYNGQKELIYDVLKRRCNNLPQPRLSTVDQFQGQQADYIILSLVRTKSVGHLRDVRRLVVALSRARLGLYIFGRWRLFKSCPELAPAMELLALRPTGHLEICTDEAYGQINGARNRMKIEGVKQMGEYVIKKLNRQ